MGGFHVTPEEVAAAATYVRGQAEEIHGKVESLRAYVAGLDQYWQGPAHGAFETLMANYHVHATRLHSALTGISHGLGANHHNYFHTEAANLASVHNVQLPPARF